MIDKRCENCIFWDSITKEVSICRRNAPQARLSLVTDNAVGVEANWPRTERNDWCGEFKFNLNLMLLKYRISNP